MGLLVASSWNFLRAIEVGSWDGLSTVLLGYRIGPGSMSVDLRLELDIHAVARNPWGR